MPTDTELRQRRGVEEVKSSTKDDNYVPWDKRKKLKPPTSPQTACRCIYFVFLFLLLAVVMLGLYLYNIESKIEPVAYSLPPHRPLAGPLAPNTILQKAERLFEGTLIGPEALSMCNGKIYTGTYDGKIVRIDNDTHFEVIAKFGKEPCGTKEHEHTCGRPLGLTPSGHGTLYIIDAYLGLFEVDCITGDYKKLVPSERTYGSKPIKFGNDVEMIPGGDIFFTDSDYKWERREFPYIVAESAPNGRLLWFNPVTKQSGIAVQNFHFANGIQISPKGDFLLICESTRFRVIKYYLQGEMKGRQEVFADLPGPPDNISPSQNGGYWVGLAGIVRKSPYEPFELIANRPLLRSILYKLISPEELLARIPKYGMIVELNQEGEIINSLHDPSGQFVGSVSEVLDTGDALYLGSFHAPYLSKVNYRSRETQH